jgi:FKBP-type peptidyl-prolyl cis-trans isomerase FkpA
MPKRGNKGIVARKIILAGYAKLSSILIFSALLALSCTSQDKPETVDRTIPGREEMLRANHFLVGKDMEIIDAYIKRRKWELEFTESGLGYQIYEKGDGPRVEKGNILTFNFTLSLLDGRICYSSQEDGPKTFRVGRGGVESGLEEGVLLLREGDKARFILPPFLAHGLIGDQSRIPARAVLVYELELIRVSQ